MSSSTTNAFLNSENPPRSCEEERARICFDVRAWCELLMNIE
jgi:hypothetical protein